jgi:hypothetical protein
MPLKRTSLLSLVSLATFAAWTPPARADVKQACVDSSTQGQSLRDAGKLTAARS